MKTVFISSFVIGAAMSGVVFAQPAPRVGYIYPAGVQAGTTVEVRIGGQFFDEEGSVIVSGEGVTGDVMEHLKLPPAQVVDDHRDRLRTLQQKLRDENKPGAVPGRQKLTLIRKLLKEVELTEKDLILMAEYDRRRNDPKQQLNNQIGETVRVRLNVEADAAPGVRHLRLRTPSGLSNPMRFIVSQLPEVREAEPQVLFDLENYRGGMDAVRREHPSNPPVMLPVNLNGRIMPGEVDEFPFRAKKGDQVVVAVQARSLIPYLADAVPGWFQSVASLHTDAGNEIAYADGYRFDPDPVLFYKIPADGLYRVRIHDSIYRGRDDFVYRISVGQLPFLVGLSPLGATVGEEREITFQGGNLGSNVKMKYTAPAEPGIVLLHATSRELRSNSIPFHVDRAPSELEREPNDRLGGSQELKVPVVVSGVIQSAGDADFYRVKGPGNREMIFEVFARRLGSPVDASLAVFDYDGKQIAFNDDHEDLASGLTTHHADSRIAVKLPADGQAFVRITDTQTQHGPSNAYRLKIHVAEPSFSLRVTPASLNSKPGGHPKVTVHALRSGGLDGPITLSLKDPPVGYEMKNAVVPTDKDTADVFITVPSSVEAGHPVALTIIGTAAGDGNTITAVAVPAEDMMQAFIYRHLVPVDELLVDVRTPPPDAKP